MPLTTADNYKEPDIRSPKVNIVYSNAESITPGHWFVAPYIDLSPAAIKSAFIPFQIGPHIFDNGGELIWSGAKLCNNRNVFDFRLQTVNGQPALTFILGKSRGGGPENDPAGVVLDTSYERLATVNLESDSYRWNLHELRIVGGNTSITTTQQTIATDVSSLGLLAHMGIVAQHGFIETNINNGQILREWLPLEAGITVTESMIAPPEEWSTESQLSRTTWDCFHTNSVDKNADGDSIVSMRYTSTIYKISGTDGSVLWRLGGKESDFIQDFNFSSQHHATFISSNDTVTIISFLDNASDEKDRQPSTASASSIKEVALYEYTSPRKAILLRQFDRPDGGLTKLRGSAQLLDNNGYFAGWSEDGYLSEFTSEGRTVLQARFSGSRFNTYRAYKFDFIGIPKQNPVLKTFAYDDGSGEVSNSSTTFFVSWNGATEVNVWEFYATSNLSVPFQKVGSAVRSTFETSFMAKAFWAYTYAEARDRAGAILGKSAVVMVQLEGQLRQKYNDSTIASEAGSISHTTASSSGMHRLEGWSAPNVVTGICIAFLALIGFVMTVRWLFTSCRRVGMRVCASAKEESHEMFAEQTEGLLEAPSAGDLTGGKLERCESPSSTDARVYGDNSADAELRRDQQCPARSYAVVP